MKKKVLYLMCCLILLVLALWMVWPTIEWSNSPAPIGYKDAELSVEFSKQKNSVIATLTNNGSETLYISGFSLNKEVDGEWVTRLHITPAVGGASADVIVLLPDQTHTQEIDVSYNVVRLSKGHYRAVCTFYTDEELKSTEQYRIVCEFDVN